MASSVRLVARTLHLFFSDFSSTNKTAAKVPIATRLTAIYLIIFLSMLILSLLERSLSAHRLNRGLNEDPLLGHLRQRLSRLLGILKHLFSRIERGRVGRPFVVGEVLPEKFLETLVIADGAALFHLAHGERERLERAVRIGDVHEPDCTGVFERIPESHQAQDDLKLQTRDHEDVCPESRLAGNPGFVVIGVGVAPGIVRDLYVPTECPIAFVTRGFPGQHVQYFRNRGFTPHAAEDRGNVLAQGIAVHQRSSLETVSGRNDQVRTACKKRGVESLFEGRHPAVGIDTGHVARELLDF